MAFSSDHRMSWSRVLLADDRDKVPSVAIISGVQVLPV